VWVGQRVGGRRGVVVLEKERGDLGPSCADRKRVGNREGKKKKMNLLKGRVKADAQGRGGGKRRGKSLL